ncbi:MAG: hypothetical protein VKL01_07385 [Limnothrix sp.]|nr:hypothetical protein [Limnothrix sp.]
MPNRLAPLLNPDRRYTFSDYFDLNISTRELVEYFGCSYHLQPLNLPRWPQSSGATATQTLRPSNGVSLTEQSRLRATYTQKLPFISLTSETAKREFYIAPLLLELLDYAPIEIEVEYSLNGGENLSGTVDYCLKAADQMLIIEAKKGDLERGFNQLAVELIALDRAIAPGQPWLYGAVTIGNVWIFGQLDRASQAIYKDLNAYTIPGNLDDLIAILLGILQAKS